MSQSIHSKLTPFVISEDTRFESIDQMKEQRDKLEDVLESLDEKDYQILPEEYTYTARPFVFPILKDQVIPFYREDSKPFIPRTLIDQPELLQEAYSAVVINGTVYSETNPDVVKAQDTERFVLKDDAYNVINGGFCELKENLIKLPQYEGFAYKKDVVKTHDTGNLDLKGNCHEWKSQGRTRYYRYPELMPNAPEKRIYFEEAVFPEADDLKETRIGIELEYSSAIQATREALKNEHFRKQWNSVRDGSIPKNGTEFVSIPFKYNELDQVKRFIEFNKENSARFNERCGFHVHIGSPSLDFIGLTSVVLLCENIQNDLLDLMPDHRKNNQFCRAMDDSFRGFKDATSNDDEKMVADIFYEDAGTSYEDRHRQSKYSVNNKRHYWVSIDRFFRFRNEPHKRTVEFRSHPATHNSEGFMSFVLLCYYIVRFGIENKPNVARTANLDDLLDWIPNQVDREKVQELLYSKKVVEYV